jgi:predicted RNA-binding protein YlxR (DUF448 family)
MMTKSSSNRQVVSKPVPQRTCVACRQIKAKKDLIRVVRTPRGEIEVDENGKKDGRGAYLCPTRECVDKALKGSHLEHTLKSSITGENREKLVRYFRDFSEGAV